MMNCATAARLMSDRMQCPLGFRARLALRVHLLLCAGCRRYGEQIALLRKWMRSRQFDVGGLLSGNSVYLDTEARRRITAAVEEHARHNGLAPDHMNDA